MDPESRRSGAALPPASHPPQGSGGAAPAIVSGKSCGTCTACCTVMGVPELKKRPWETCPHVAAGTGCRIYLERPAGCRTFICGWLLDPNMGPELKPENCHIVFYQRNEQNIVAACDPAYPGAWREPTVTAFLHRLAQSLGPERKVILMERGRVWFVTESAIVPSDVG